MADTPNVLECLEADHQVKAEWTYLSHYSIEWVTRDVDGLTIYVLTNTQDGYDDGDGPTILRCWDCGWEINTTTAELDFNLDYL